MRRSISLFTLLSFLSAQLFAQDKSQAPLRQRETVQISGNGLDKKLLHHPTFALFTGASRDLYSQGSVLKPAINVAGDGQWKIGITATVFWVGEPPIGDDPGNLVSAWDPNWLESADLKTHSTSLYLTTMCPTATLSRKPGTSFRGLGKPTFETASRFSRIIG
jgi:hypothetical protein